MQNVLLIIHVILAIAMIGVILLQRSEGGGLGMARSESSLLTTRGTANLLTRATAVLATAFFLTSLGLAILAGRTSGGGSIFDRPAPAATPPAATQPAAPPAAPPAAGTAPGAAPATSAPAPAAPSAPTR
ncbi:MAG: preprotein translocase subunit SecG [Alphaproteobacteria bacterium]|jgi:preprotein translocase subunit SecG|nr:preprotein translocase subunit SecG [Alphaproteobacteria bacterium]